MRAARPPRHEAKTASVQPRPRQLAQSGSDTDGWPKLIDGLSEMAGRTLTMDEWLGPLRDEPYRNV
jgi:hypothetical protein